METGRYRRSVGIAAPLAEVLSFSADPVHLPKWTRFFLSVETATEGFNPAVTVFGSARVRMPVQKNRDGFRILLEVESAVGRSVASIDLEESGQECRVTFTTGFPEAWPPDRVASQLLKLEQELATLKTCLERRPQGLVENNGG